MSRKANQHGYQDHLEFQSKSRLRVKEKIAVLKSLRELLKFTPW